MKLVLPIESANSTYSYTNIEWTTTDNGATWATNSQMLWEGANKTASIYAYAPYVESATDITAVPFTIDTDQATNGTASSDLLGFTQTAFNPYNQLNVKQAVDITFDHILSKLTLTLSFGDQFDNTVTVSSVKLVGTNAAVSYNAKEKEVVAATPAVVAPISMQKEVGATNSYTAILAPQTITAGAAMIDVTLSNGSTYRYIAATGNHIFAKGTAYTMNLKVGKDKLEIDGSVVVSDWETDTDNPFADGGEAEGAIVVSSETNTIKVNIPGNLTAADVDAAINGGTVLNVKGVINNDDFAKITAILRLTAISFKEATFDGGTIPTTMWGSALERIVIDRNQKDAYAAAWSSKADKLFYEGIKLKYTSPLMSEEDYPKIGRAHV